MLKAIETTYNGYRFRSRLEARWAVFFDAMKVSYHYEEEGYDLSGTWYLPDFKIKSLPTFMEIKPGPPSEDEQRKARLLAEHSDHIVLIACGDPWHTTQIHCFLRGGDFGSPMYWSECLLCTGLALFGQTKANGRFAECFNCCKPSIVQPFEIEKVLRGRHIMAAYTAARSARFEHGERP